MPARARPGAGAVPGFAALALVAACAAPAPAPSPVPAWPGPRAYVRPAFEAPPAAVAARPTPRVAASPGPTPTPLAPSRTRRRVPVDLIDALIGLPPGTAASLAGKPGHQAYEELAARAPAALARMVAIAGGQERLESYFASLGTLLPMSIVTAAGPGGAEIVIYDRANTTVRLSLGLDTPVAELTALPALFDRFMYYTTNPGGVFKLYRYDFLTQLVDPLPVANGPFDVVFPSVGLAKRLVAYAELTPEGPRLRLFDALRNAKLLPAATRDDPCVVPRLDTFEERVAYATTLPDGTSDVRIFHVDEGRVESPPFVNSPANELQPAFSIDDRQLVFISDRHGSPDLYLADLTTGLVEDLVLANSPGIEAFPRFSGPNELVFLSDRSGSPLFYAYRLDTHALQPLPVQPWLPPGNPEPTP